MSSRQPGRAVRRPAVYAFGHGLDNQRLEQEHALACSRVLSPARTQRHVFRVPGREHDSAGNPGTGTRSACVPRVPPSAGQMPPSLGGNEPAGFAMPSESKNANSPSPDHAEDESPRTSHAARSPRPPLRGADWGSASEDGPKSSAPLTFKQGSSICIFELFPECTPPIPSVDISIAPRCSPISAPCIEVPTAPH